MKSNKLWNAIGEIDEKYIEEAAPKDKKTHGKRIFMRCALVAACMIFIVSVCVGAFAVAAEAKEYKEAVEFFDQYGMSTEGLSRGEIKAVYRDITTKSFTYSKTAEVIRNSMINDTVSGYEISQDDPTHEDIAKLWDYKNYPVYYPQTSKDGIHYNVPYDVNDSGIEKRYLEKYEGETLLWKTYLSYNVSVDYPVRIVSGGVIVCGTNYVNSSNDIVYPWIIKVDNDGNIVWKYTFNNGNRYELIEDVVENDDGGCTVFSKADRGYLGISRFSASGERLFYLMSEIGNYKIRNAANFGDGYLVQLGDYSGNQPARIVKLDSEGRVTNTFDYSSEDVNYHISDMIEYNGKIYLSAYATPKLSEEENDYGGRDEIARILKYAFSRHASGEMPLTLNEDLTSVVRENYTAILLVCDPNEGTPKEFYSVKGSLGGKLAMSDTGKLSWDVESFIDVRFSPATSSFSIAGKCNIFRYTFDNNGALISQEKTVELTDYRR